MRIAYVRMAGFRGFKDVTQIDFAAGFVVLTGRNGAGKSTVLDAIDFALTGTINKYSVVTAKGGGLGEHIWWVGDGIPAEHYVSVGFISADGSVFEVRRSRERGFEGDLSALASYLCKDFPAETWPETLVRTSLIRDETISALSLDLPEQQRFMAVRDAIGGLTGPDHSARTSAILNAAKSAKADQLARTQDLQAELGRTLSSLTEARSVAERLPSAQEAERLILQVDPELSHTTPDELAKHISERRERLSGQHQLLLQLEEATADLALRDPEQHQQEIQKAIEALEALQAAEKAAEKRVAQADAAVQTSQAVDDMATHLAQIAEHGEAIGLIDGHCPLCDAAQSEQAFFAAVAATRERLAAAGSLAAGAIDELSQANSALRLAKAETSKAKEILDELKRRDELLISRVKVLSDKIGEHLDLTQATPEGVLDLEVIRSLLLRTQEQNSVLERALFIRQSSNAQERVFVLEDRVVQLRRAVEIETSKLAALERAQDAAKQIDGAAKSVANEILTEQFDIVLPLLKELYRRLRPHTDWREIETDFGGTVRASLNFTVGEGRNPQFLFSSGQRRAAGIAFLLAIHLSRPWCKLQTLLLDDPVQHIDDYRALNLVEVLSAIRHTGRQVIIAVEDIALAELLCRRLRSTGTESGMRLELAMSKEGSAYIERKSDVFPLPQEVLAEAS